MILLDPFKKCFEYLDQYIEIFFENKVHYQTQIHIFITIETISGKLRVEYTQQIPLGKHIEYTKYYIFKIFLKRIIDIIVINTKIALYSILYLGCFDCFCRENLSCLINDFTGHLFCWI